MYHSVLFTPKKDKEYTPMNTPYNTYTDFHLIPSKRPSFDAPEVDFYLTNELEHRPISLVDSRRAEKIKRSASWSFIVENGYDWTVVYTDLLHRLHGRICTIKLEDDPSFYYRGKVTVGNWSSEQHYSTISINVEAEPYKYKDMVEEEFTAARKTIAVNSDFIVPAIITLLPRTGISNLVISGIARNRITLDPETITISSIEAGHEFVIDGVRKRITLDGSTEGTFLNNITLWSFPTLLPGNNTIDVNSSVQTTISYEPRYL